MCKQTSSKFKTQQQVETVQHRQYWHRSDAYTEFGLNIVCLKQLCFCFFRFLLKYLVNLDCRCINKIEIVFKTTVKFLMDTFILFWISQTRDFFPGKLNKKLIERLKPCASPCNLLFSHWEEHYKSCCFEERQVAQFMNIIAQIQKWSSIHAQQYLDTTQ